MEQENNSLSNKLFCKECGKEYKNFIGLSNHIARGHKITLKEYYDNYLKKDINEGICLGLNCGKETNFTGLKYGYYKFCSHKCSNKSEITKQKSEQTNLIKRGVENVSQCEKVKNKNIETNLRKRGVRYSFQSEEVIKKSEYTCKNRYGVKNWSSSPQGLLLHRTETIKLKEKQKENNEPLIPNIGPIERELLNEFQKYTIFDIIRNDPSFRYVIGRFPDGHIKELCLFIQFDERYHFLDREQKIYKQDDLNCTSELSSLGYIVWRVSEWDWIHNREKIIKQFKILIECLTEEYIK